MLMKRFLANAIPGDELRLKNGDDVFYNEEYKDNPWHLIRIDRGDGKKYYVLCDEIRWINPISCSRQRSVPCVKQFMKNGHLCIDAIYKEIQYFIE